MAVEGSNVERVLGRLGSSAHGVVTRSQLLGAGVTRSEIEHRLRTGALLSEHRGVYRVGHRAPSLEARYLAAVRACGERAVLSGRAAACLLGLIKGRPPPAEVTAPTERRVEGVITHRSLRLQRRDWMICKRVPVTTVPRTLVDIAADTPADELARACHEAGVRYRTTPRDVESVLARWRGAPGATKLRRIMRGDERVTLSKLESGFLRRLREARLPLPRTNRPAGGRHVDCRWPDYRLTVELDSYRYHHSRYAWEQDRHREREARARGDEFRRYTWGDVSEDPELMLAELQALLGD